MTSISAFWAVTTEEISSVHMKNKLHCTIILVLYNDAKLKYDYIHIYVLLSKKGNSIGKSLFISERVIWNIAKWYVSALLKQILWSDDRVNISWFMKIADSVIRGFNNTLAVHCDDLSFKQGYICALIN